MSDEFEAEAERLFECAHNNFGWMPIVESLRKAYEGGRAEEREACAKIAETTYAQDAFHFELGTAVADRIRAQAAKDKVA